MAQQTTKEIAMKNYYVPQELKDRCRQARWSKVKEQYPGEVPEDVKAEYLAKQKELKEEVHAAWLAEQNGGHLGKILYFGSIIASALSGFWLLAGILVFLGLLWLVLMAFARFPLVTTLVGFAGFIYVLFLVML